jgi:hypothetical protein
MIITQSPTFPNGTQSDILYVVSGSFAGSPQHRYICKISSGGDTLSTVKQTANQYGYGVFEVSRLLDDHMGYETPWLVSGSVPFTNSPSKNVNEFLIQFAEEYGSSLTSPIVTSAYISASAETNTQVIPAVTERDAGQFNWPSSSYDALTNAPNAVSAVNNSAIDKALVVSGSDYMTISSFCGIAPKEHWDRVVINVYNSSLTSVYNTSYTNPYSHTPLVNKLLHAGIGPANLQSVGSLSTYFADPDSYPYYSVYLDYSGGNSSYYLFNLGCLQRKGSNFAFINKQGVYDYYRAALVDTERESFNRSTYQAPYINYSTDSQTIGFDYARRGETQYLNKFQNNYTTETDWLTTDQATWLFELFESPSVFVQVDQHFEPIIITNAEEQYRTNVAGQRMFKFTIQYRKANAKHSRY